MITMTHVGECLGATNVGHPTLKGDTSPGFSQSIIQIGQVRAGEAVLRECLQLELGVGLLPTC